MPPALAGRGDATPPAAAATLRANWRRLMADTVGRAPCEQRDWLGEIVRHMSRAALLVARTSRPKQPLVTMCIRPRPRCPPLDARNLSRRRNQRE
eukprot:scaffold18430_cov111-Isochrysis_galbana.AAC.2